MSKANGLMDLPEEILKSVLKDVERWDLAALSQTCRKAHERLLGRLFATMDFDLRKNTSLKDRPHPAALAVRSVIENQTLINLVESINIAILKDLPYESVPPPEELDIEWLSAFSSHTDLQPQHIISACSKLVQQQLLAQEVEKLWLISLSQCRLEAILACLILQSTNIRLLRLGARVLVPGLLDTLLSHILSNRQHNVLATIGLSEDLDSEADVLLLNERGECAPYDCLSSILNLPAITTLVASLPDLNLKIRAFTPGSTLQSLTISNTGISEDSLGYILKITQQLKKLTYVSVWDFDVVREGRSRDRDDFLDCQLLGQYLAQVQNTLEELVISVQYFSFASDWVGFGYHGMTGSLTNLRHFQKLETLMVPYVVLLGCPDPIKHEPKDPQQLCDTLPPHLSSLTLTDDLVDLEPVDWEHNDLLEQVQEVSQHFHSKNLSMSVHLRNSYCDDERDQSLKELFEISNVPCQVLDKEQLPKDDTRIPVFTVKVNSISEVDKRRVERKSERRWQRGRNVTT